MKISFASEIEQSMFQKIAGIEGRLLIEAEAIDHLVKAQDILANSGLEDYSLEVTKIIADYASMPERE